MHSLFCRATVVQSRVVFWEKISSVTGGHVLEYKKPMDAPPTSGTGPKPPSPVAPPPTNPIPVSDGHAHDHHNHQHGSSATQVRYSSQRTRGGNSNTVTAWVAARLAGILVSLLELTV
jgi:hypothetical protein